MKHTTMQFSYSYFKRRVSPYLKGAQLFPRGKLLVMLTLGLKPCLGPQWVCEPKAGAIAGLDISTSRKWRADEVAVTVGFDNIFQKSALFRIQYLYFKSYRPGKLCLSIFAVHLALGEHF